VDLEAVQLSAPEEVRQLVGSEVARSGLVRAEGMLMFEPPEGAFALLWRETICLAVARTAIGDENAPARLIELAVPDNIAGDELSEPVEQLAGEWVGSGDALGVAQEAKHAPEIGMSQGDHDTEDTTIFV
jgi:hypothetical protein